MSSPVPFPEPSGTSPRDPEEVAGELATAAARLADLAGVPVAEHVSHYDEVHTRLQDALASIDGV